MKLPQAFYDKMKELLKEEFEDYLNSFEKGHYMGGIRVNTLKLTPEEFKDIAPFNIKRIPWIKKGFYYDETLQPAKHPYYYAGMYYIQEPSAMTPASILPIEEGDRVLDLCAAPGGKSTELASKLCGKGILVANDISNSRAKALLKNIEVFGVKNAVVISETPAKLADEFEGFFNKVLVDAPCSGEGMFRKTPAIMKNWEQYGTGYYAKLQREILPSAVKMLSEDGYMLYSTCTFSPEEDEKTVAWLLESYPELELAEAIPDDIRKNVENTIMRELKENEDISYEGFSFGRPEWIEEGKEELKRCIRLWPHKIGGEGHFLALFKKKSGKKVQYAGEVLKSSINKISDEAVEFLKNLKFDIDFNKIIIKEDRLYLLPDYIGELKGFRILRSGLLLGEQKKGRFEPSQALACALKAEEYDNVYNLSSKDIDVIKYLKCESIELKEKCKDGFVLICVDGYPLGWGKVSKSSFKNKFLPGWRMM